MQNSLIKLACRRSDRTAAILNGEVKISGIDLLPLGVSDGQKLFSGINTGEYDAGEFSFAELVHNIAQDRTDILGIPVFPTRAFRHGFIFYNTRSPIEGRKDLRGKKIGFRQWIETASVWIRGTLLDEYAISPSDATWHTVSMHHWESGDAEKHNSLGDFQIHWLEKCGRNPGESAEMALLDGRIDVLGTVPAPASLKDGRVKRLFEFYKDVEMAYFKSTAVFPIMHLVVVRTSLVERFPNLPEKLFKLFVDSKKSYYRAHRELPRVWPNCELSEERELFNGDPWTYGLAANTNVVSKFLTYCHSQGISNRELTPEDLFFQSTFHLKE